jgi:hypothetical protein
MKLNPDLTLSLFSFSLPLAVHLLVHGADFHVTVSPPGYRLSYLVQAASAQAKGDNRWRTAYS